MTQQDMATAPPGISPRTYRIFLISASVLFVIAMLFGPRLSYAVSKLLDVEFGKVVIGH